jgi:hypothetical protein
LLTLNCARSPSPLPSISSYVGYAAQRKMRATVHRRDTDQYACSNRTPYARSRSIFASGKPDCRSN